MSVDAYQQVSKLLEAAKNVGRSNPIYLPYILAMQKFLAHQNNISLEDQSKYNPARPGI